MKTRLLIFLSVLIILIQTPGHSQTPISGAINIYTKVISQDKSDKVTVESATGFNPGDTALLIQMNGAVIDPSSNTIINMNQTGRYEFIIVQSIVSNQVRFSSNLINSYDTDEGVQLIRTPSYKNAKAAATLTCEPWNGRYGGVLAFFVEDTLELQADIDVSAKGFRGGDKTWGNSNCYQSPKGLNFLATSDSAGMKGESMTISTYPYKRGFGANANGGGGGNGFGSGGGGGAGYATGGYGGQASVLQCGSITALGGHPGESSKDYFAGFTPDQGNRIFPGGGGGAGKAINETDISKGGNGGGIVFLIASRLITNNFTIHANGESVSGIAENMGGNGGGGGGGSVLLAVDTISGPLNIEASGGKGGNTGICSGQGGGGGGGFLWFTGQKLPEGSLNLEGGQPGTSTMGICQNPAFSGGTGDSSNYLNPVLNGFLFNKIENGQTICSGTSPEKLTGTLPKGGNGEYSFGWQFRSKNTSYNWQPVAGADQKDYSPPSLMDTTDYRRIVKSHTSLTNEEMADTSRWVRIQVVPPIGDISISPSDTIVCSGQILNIRGSSPTGGDRNKPYQYQWQFSTDSISWTNAMLNPEKDFNQKSDQTWKFLRRKIKNNVCVAISNTVKLTILSAITNNLTGDPQTICSDATPVKLSGTQPSGGDLHYSYKWVYSTDSIHFSSLTPEDTTMDYVPGPMNASRFYRRIVYSGLRNTCTDSGTVIQIKVIPSIQNNTILNNETVCQSTVPEILSGSTPSGGDAKYMYEWDSSDDKISWTPAGSAKDYQSGPLNSSKYFRRIVYSGINHCCKDTSTTGIIDVQAAIENNAIAGDQVICYKQIPQKLEQKSGIVNGGNGVFNFQWYERAYDSGTWNLCKDPDQLHFQSEALTKTTHFRRKIVSGSCISLSDSVTVTVLPSITNNLLNGNPKVCADSVPEKIKGSLPAGGNGSFSYLWQDSLSSWSTIDGVQSADYSPSRISQPVSFRRIVVSGPDGCCKSISEPFLLDVNQIPKNVNAGEDQELDFQFNSMLNASLPSDCKGTWSSGNKNIVIKDLQSPFTEIEKLTLGKNVFIWTVTNGTCPSVSDTVVVTVDNLKVYTGFSPNNDGKNETFKIKGIENSTKRKLTILNRWGEIVYSSENYNNDWDGTYQKGGPLPDDTYFYILEADHQKIYKGFFILKR